VFVCVCVSMCVGVDAGVGAHRILGRGLSVDNRWSAGFTPTWCDIVGFREPCIAYLLTSFVCQHPQRTYKQL
jgi:hypothetical protein